MLGAWSCPSLRVLPMSLWCRVSFSHRMEPSCPGRGRLEPIQQQPHCLLFSFSYKCEELVLNHFSSFHCQSASDGTLGVVDVYTRKGNSVKEYRKDCANPLYITEKSHKLCVGCLFVCFAWLEFPYLIPLYRGWKCILFSHVIFTHNFSWKITLWYFLHDSYIFALSSFIFICSVFDNWFISKCDSFTFMCDFFHMIHFFLMWFFRHIFFKNFLMNYYYCLMI